MLKNTCLSLTFALLSCASQETVMAAEFMSSTKAAMIETINAAKTDIMLEKKTALMIKEQAEKHFQNVLGDTYKTKKQKCLQVLENIASSDEFSSTLEQVTDEQARLITQDMVAYNDIVVDPSAYSLEQKVATEISLAGFSEEEESLFNVFYVVFAIVRGTTMLIEKLEHIEIEKGLYLE